MTVEIKFDRTWAEVERKIVRLGQRMPIVLDQAIMQEAHYLRGKIIDKIDGGVPPAHSPLTVAVRRFRGFGGTKVLVASGALRGGVNVVKLPGGGAFVGVHRTAKRGDGKSAVRIAEIHENGRTWQRQLTPKQRRFLMAALRSAGIAPSGSGSGTATTFRIPARRFIGPVLESEGRPERMGPRLAETIERLLRGA